MALVGMNQIVELRSHYVDVIWELEDPPVETIQQFQVSQSVSRGAPAFGFSTQGVR